MQNRVEQIDIAKGIGIFFVVLGHNRLLTNAVSGLHTSLYLFHMPLFFLLSGLTTPLALDRGKLAKRVLGLLKPYLAGVLLLLPFQLRNADHPSNHGFLLNIVWGTGNAIYNTPLWFLPALAVAYVLYAGLQRARGALGTLHRFPMGALAMIGITYYLLDSQVGFGSLPKDAWGHSLGAPWSADLGLLVAAFLMLGSWWQTKQHQAAHSSGMWMAALVASLSLFAACWTQGPDLDLNFRIAKVWPMAMLSGIAGIVAVLSLSHLIDRHSLLIKKALVLLGQHTLIILIFHVELQRQLTHLITVTMPTNGAVLAAASLVVCFALAWLSKNVINRHRALRQMFYVS